MVDTISKRIDEVRLAAGASWRHGDTVSEWAKAFGTDLRAAWSSCPRGDFLAALTSLVDYPVDALHVRIVGMARELVSLGPSEDASFQELAGVVSQGWVHAPFSFPRLRAYQDLASRLRAEEEADATRARSLRAFADEALSHLAQRVRAPTNGGPSESPHELLVEELLVLPELDDMRTLHVAQHRRATTALAARALLTSFSFSRLCAVTRDRWSGARARNARLAVGRITNRHTLAALAADFVHQVVLARTWSTGATDEAWKAGLVGLASFIVDTIDSRRETPNSSSMWSAFEATFETHLDRQAHSYMEQYAAQLREVGPEWELSLDGASAASDEDCAEAEGRNERDLLREVLEEVAHIGLHLPDRGLEDATHIALAVVGAPGPLDLAKLGQVMMTVQERFIDVVRATADQLGEREGRKWRELAQVVEERFKRTIRELERQRPGPFRPD